MLSTLLAVSLLAAPPTIQGRQPGVAVRVYSIGKNLERIPKLLPDQKPNAAFVTYTVDIVGSAFSVDPSDQFYAVVTGTLTIEKPGDYTFRLTSDDGSILTIGDKVAINNDGLNAGTPKEGTITLAAGEYPLQIEYFDNTEKEFLRLEWKAPGAGYFDIVPLTALSTPGVEGIATAPGFKEIVDPTGRAKPGDALPLKAVHPAFEAETAVPDTKAVVTGMDFLGDGRLAYCTAAGDVFVVDGLGGKDLGKVAVSRLATGLKAPNGMKFANGALYILQQGELSRIKDLKAGTVEKVAGGWATEDGFSGLTFDKGFFYATMCTDVNSQGRAAASQNRERGKVLKIALDGKFEIVASSIRGGNGVGLGPKNTLLATDQLGDSAPAPKLLFVQPGAVSGSQPVKPDSKTPEAAPLAWLPYGEACMAPSQPVALGAGPYRDQILVGDALGGITRVFVESVNGVAQGTAFRFSQGFLGGVNRMAWGRDRKLYVGESGAIQRLKFNGKAPFELLAVRAKTNGLELELTQPLKEGLGESPGDYQVRTWRYQATEAAGGPKVDERGVVVRSVSVSRDRKKVFLEITDLVPGNVMYIRLNQGLMSKSGADLWTTEAWKTLNAVPENAVAKVPTEAAPTNVLSPEEAKEGFELLYDGKSLAAFRGWKQTDVPGTWRSMAGEIRLELDPGKGGDLTTRKQYGDFDLRLEWKASEGGNSGVIFRATEDVEFPWHIGPEMQFLDNDRAADGRFGESSAGACFGLYPCVRSVARPAGYWNEVRIVAKGTHVDYWLNRQLVVSYDIGTEDWKKRVALSKFAEYEGYGTRKRGYIVLQDQGNRLAFRNIRIKELEQR